MVENSQKLMSISTSHETRLSDLSLSDTFLSCKTMETRMAELIPKFGKKKLKLSKVPASTLGPTWMQHFI